MTGVSANGSMILVSRLFATRISFFGVCIGALFGSGSGAGVAAFFFAAGVVAGFLVRFESGFAGASVAFARVSSSVLSLERRADRLRGFNCAGSGSGAGCAFAVRFDVRRVNLNPPSFSS
jgi:hypothetical protein